MRTKNLIASALVVSAASAVPSLHAAFVYDNSTSDLTNRLPAGNIEIGDEVILGGTGRLLTDISFSYYGLNFDGNEAVRLRLYANTGGAYNGDPQYQMPAASAFYDSGFFSVGPTSRNKLKYGITGGLDEDGAPRNGLLPSNIILPERFTVSVQFSGIAIGENAGVDLYGPPTIGQSEADYWQNDGTGWKPLTNNVVPTSFGMRIQAVPEPSTWALAVVGGLCGLALVRRRTSKS